MLSADEALTLGYLLWGTADDRKVFAGFLLRRHGQARIAAHNFFVGSKREEAFLQVNGVALLSLARPLFPAETPELSTLNQRVLAEAQVTGAGTNDTNNGIFRHAKPADDVVGGEFWAPVQATAQGFAVDLTPVEEAFKSLRNQVNSYNGRQAPMRNFRRSQGGTAQGQQSQVRSSVGSQFRRGPRGGRAPNDEQKTCFLCGELGHVQRFCSRPPMHGSQDDKKADQGKREQSRGF